MKSKHDDFVSFYISHLSHKIHPSLGKLYDKHTKFFNFGVVELICLLFANLTIGLLSFYYVGLPLVLLSFCLITPVTFLLKYFANKLWVWEPK